MLKDSQNPGPWKCAAFNGAQHIFSQAKLFQNMISNSVHHFDTTAGVIRVSSLPTLEFKEKFLINAGTYFIFQSKVDAFVVAIKATSKM